MATNVDAKLLKQTKFPPEFNLKVDMKKVNVEVLKKWIAGRISEVLGNEDDVVIELCFNLLEGSRFPDIKVLQIQLTGFLDKDTPKFCKDLWTLCLSAQSNPQGVPKELLEAKKAELIQEKIDAEKAAQEAQRRTEQERLSEDEEEDEVAEHIMTMKGAPPGIQDLHLHAADNHHTALIIVGLHRAITLTRIFLVIEMGVQAGHQQPHVETIGEIEGKGRLVVVVIELDPIHLQTRLAHDRPEDPEGGAVLPSHPAEIEGTLGDQEYLHLTPVMKWLMHALMLVRDEATMTAAAEAVAAIAADSQTVSLPEKPQAGVRAPRGDERGSGTDQ
ncbi:MAG: hypothetical protein Q9179_005605 [Wetmoreana sp. 5 TL-2023]